MPTVTIIVAVYNIEKYISKCIESIICQTYQNVEILLIDDGSTDESGKICDIYAEKDRRIRVIHKENGGISDVRNVGLQEAKGKYFLYVDGDDFIEPDCVEQSVACAEHHDAEVVIYDYEELEEATGRREVCSAKFPGNQVVNVENHPEILVFSPSPCNKLYRTEFWRKTGLEYPVGRVYEDLTVTPQLLLNAKRVVYLQNKPMYHYILHEGSIMREKNFKKSYENRKAALEDILSYFKQKNIFEKYRKELEYLMFEHAYFIPTKEVLYYNPKSEYLNKFGEYVFSIFPDADKNVYVRNWLSGKDRLILFLMKRKQYKAIQFLSKIRKQKDLILNKNK